MRQQSLKIMLTLGTIVIVVLWLVAGPLVLDNLAGPGHANWAIRAAPGSQGTSVTVYLPVIMRNAPLPNLPILHQEASTVPVERCIQCHGDKAREESQDPLYPTAHRVHLTSALLNVECTTCHQSADLLQGSAASLRKQVDVELCATCHSPFPSMMQPAWKNLDCTTCHSDWQERMAEATLVNLDAITAQDCLKCHGGAAWYQERR